VWTVVREGEHRIAYVGEASNLMKRQREHVIWTLGGGYCLYETDELIQGRPPAAKYRPDTLLTNFLGNFSDLFKLALDNLTTYRFWWSTLREGRAVRRAVESAVIQAARQHGDPLQNAGVSLLPGNCGPLTITSKFLSDVRVPAARDHRALELWRDVDALARSELRGHERPTEGRDWLAQGRLRRPRCY
jgi:hypothetical protein